MNIDVIKSENINETIYKKTLKSGLEVFYMPKKGYNKKFAIFATNYGSNDNEFIPINKNDFIKMPEGIAHFLEHKMFEEPEGNIFNEFSKLGSYVNAYTNFNQTAYLFSCSDNFDDNLKLLIKFVQTPYFTDENVNKEKGIIEQEIRMYDDNPNWKVFFNCLRGMYINHPVRIDIAGTVDSIKQIDKNMLYDCYNTFYNPKNMTLFLVGDINFEESLKTIESIAKNDYEDYEGNIKRKKIEEPSEINKSKIEEDLSVSVPLFNIGFKDSEFDLDGDGLFKKQICTEIILDILFSNSSKFYLENYEDGIINSTFGAQYVGNIDYGHSIIGGESNNPMKLLDNLISYIKEIKEHGLNKEDFNRTKKKFIGHHLMNLNSPEYIANNFISYHFKGTTLLKYIEILESVKYDDVINRIKEHLREDNYTISIINPKK